jgi:hypothetical protein
MDFFTYDIYSFLVLIFIIVFIVSLIGFFLFLKDNRKISKFFLVVNALSIILVSTFNNISNGLLKSKQIKNSVTISLQLKIQSDLSNLELQTLFKKIKNININDKNIVYEISYN